MNLRSLIILFPAILAAQTTGILNLYPSNPATEANELNQAVTESNGSAVDLTRALEQHLKKYPNSPRRAEIDAALYKTATESNDSARIATYGERILTGKPDNELQVLDRVIRAMLEPGEKQAATRATPYITRYINGVLNMRSRAPEGHTTAAQWADLGDRAFASATILDARASGLLGNMEDAATKANRAWLLLPNAESAHEMANWAEKLGRQAEAIEHYADAAMIDDPRFPWSDRERDRKRATELFVKLHGTENGVGDLFMKAWDRDAQALKDRTARYRAMDVNYGLTSMYEFKLPGSGVSADERTPLDMSKLKGKTLIVDFWATWCVPCLAQHPLIEHVKQKYAKAADVVFLSLNADDDHSLVVPFIKAQKWEQRVYLEGGLAGLLNVSSLPTILVMDPYGRIYSRMTGFDGNIFERMLSTRIDEARSVLPPR